jgi:hypothetical protein
MIDYYYEFPIGTRVFDQPTRYALLRGYHPEEASTSQHLFHNQCYTEATRVWLENANGAVLVREHGQDVHEKIHPKEMTWIKLQAREIEIL